MTCPREELTALCDGALGPAERARVEAHLDGCGDCRAERDRIAATLAVLARLPAPPAPSPGFERRFYARLAREEKGGPWGLGVRARWKVWVPAAAAGAAALLVALGLRERHRAEFLASHLDLLQSYEVVASVGDLSDEDAEVVAHLDELEGRQ